MKSIIVEGKNIQSALDEAAKQLKTNLSGFTYEVIDEPKKRGFLNLFKATGVKIRADVVAKAHLENDELNDLKTKSTLREELFDVKPTETGRPGLDGDMLKIKNLLNEILGKLLQHPYEINYVQDESHDIFDVKSDEFAEMLFKKKKLSESLEYLMRKVQKRIQTNRIVIIDSNSRRELIKQDLTKLAQEMSQRVREKKQPIILDNRSAYERRIIHLTLSKEVGVYTKSVGDGAQRKLMILPKQSNELS